MITASLLSIFIIGTQSNASMVQLKPGSYLRPSFIKALKGSRSPIKSTGKGGVLEIEVTNTEEQTILVPVFNFHDGSIQYKLSQNLVATPVEKFIQVESFILALPKPGTIFIPTPGPYSGEYVYVGSLDEFFRKNTIAGDYVDSIGRKYHFMIDGRAIFPDRQFTYHVGCDHFEMSFDYLYGKDFTWAFEVEERSLKLFKCTDQAPSNHDSTPFLVLHRIPK